MGSPRHRDGSAHLRPRPRGRRLRPGDRRSPRIRGASRCSSGTRWPASSSRSWPPIGRSAGSSSSAAFLAQPGMSANDQREAEPHRRADPPDDRRVDRPRRRCLGDRPEHGDRAVLLATCRRSITALGGRAAPAAVVPGDPRDEPADRVARGRRRRSIVCRDDRAINPDWVRTAARERLGVEAIELDGGHSPFLTRPGELAEVLDSLA